MPLNKLDNFLKNVEGRILYVSPSDLDASDAMSNQGNSQTTPFKTIQRALIEASRFSYVPGSNNDITEKTTILLMPGEHIIDNRPGLKIKDNNGNAEILDQANQPVTDGLSKISLNLESNFDLTQEDNILYKFNSVEGGVIVPRGTSIVGLDLRKTKIRPKYVPNPTDDDVPESAIFRITGACYFWQFSLFDGSLSDKVYVNHKNFNAENFVKPTFSHHKLTCFEYADGVNKDPITGITDLNMYYYKLSRAYGDATEDRKISEKFPAKLDGFVSKRPEFEIVGAFAPDPISISNIISGDGNAANTLITVTTATDHGLDVGTPIRVKGVGESGYNISTNVTSISDTNPRVFTYNLTTVSDELKASNVDVSNATVIVETDTVNGASPYIFNISLRSVFGMNGMHTDGAKATGFRSMVVAQFTGVSLQKDDRAFVKYNPSTRTYNSIAYESKTGDALASESSASNSNEVYHLDSGAIYRKGWETRHVKISNDAILQIVSVFAIGYGVHFEGRSGSDASITNSNSNFGQLALVSDGFKRDAFLKDDRAFITHIIPPRAITTPEENIDWVSIDNQNADANRIYLFGFNSEDIKPPSLTQGFRIGAKTDDLLFVNIGGTEYSAKIVMDGTAGTTNISGVKVVNNITVDDSSHILTSTNHGLVDGEKVVIFSENGDLPENIEEKTVYFVRKNTSDTFRLATSLTNANNNETIAVIGGTNLSVLSRVTDKECGDFGHPVQYDNQTHNQWYINVDNTNNTITGALSFITERTEPSFVKRKSDTRSLDEKIYKLRLAIPKEITNSKNPENGFVIQESSSTDVRNVGDFTKNNDLTTQDYLFNRNPRFISTCTFNSTLKTVTVGLEKPHNLSVGDLITVKNIKDANNTTGIGNSGFNRETTVTKIIDGLTFEYSTGNETFENNVTSATNDFNDKTSDNLRYPLYQRTDLKSNIYIFRNNIISDFINNTSDGVYQVFALNSSNSLTEEFTNLNYSQNVVDVYPQLDRDNIDENPKSSKTFALRSPLGQVNTNNPLNSITRETTDKLLTKIGAGLVIKSDTNSGVVSFTQDHNIGGLLAARLTGGSGYVDGTYYNVKVYTSTSQSSDTWNGTLATVIVSGNAVGVATITNPGSDMLGKIGYFDNAALGGGSGATLTNSYSPAEPLSTVNVGVSADLVLQTTGGGLPDSYFRIIGTENKNDVSIAKTTGDFLPKVGQYGFLVGPAVSASFTTNNSLTTFTTSDPHGLVVGNRFQLNDVSNNNRGTFIVKSRIGPTVFTAFTNNIGQYGLGSGMGFILKHGLSANDGLSGKGNENLTVRGVELFNKETATLASPGMNTDPNAVVKVTLSGNINSDNILKRFPYGSYILIDQEIMRVKSNTLTGVVGSENEISVIRGVFGTTVSSHISSSLIKSINAFPIQFNRPSIIRASGHTFEYLGYGPGNYSTALPQVQVKTISEREEFLSQSQERAGGAVVYTGMNNKGDFYIGNQKKSALTGEETSFDTPIPSVAGEDPGRLSVVFDEVTVKDRIVIEGGKSKTVLSEFDGPTTFNNEVQFKDVVKIKTTTDSTSPSTGALVISGGVGFAKTAHFIDDAALKFGNSGDLEISHETVLQEPDANVIRSKTVGGLDRDLFLQSNDKVRITNTTGSVQSAIFNVGAGVNLYHNTSTKFETLGVGATVSGTMFATNFSGSASGLTGLNENSLKDSNDVTRVQATTSGATITGTLNINGGQTLTGNLGVTGQITATTNADAIPAIIATNTGGVNSIIQRWVGGSGGLEIQNDASGDGPGDYRIANTAGSSDQRITLYNSVDVNGGGIRFECNDEFRMDIRLDSVRIGDPTRDDINLLVTGDITAFHASDIRLKDNISPITKALEKVKSISGNTYTKKSDGSAHTGVIAQEIEALGLPGITTTRSSGYMAVDYEKLVPLLIEAIKELSAEVDTLKNK